MRNICSWLVSLSLGLVWIANAQAQEGPNPDAPSLPEPADEEAVEGDRFSQLEEQIAELKERVRQGEAERQVASPLTINGYVDFGFFAPMGNNGVGYTRDVANRQFPQYRPFAWTFLGDILGSTINSRGEAADLGDAPGVDRFDSVNSDGAAGFIANELNMRIGYALSENAILRTSVNFIPRSGNQDFSLGDFVEADIAELEYVLTEDGNTSLFVGKMLPVFGIEYKDRKSDQRFGVTPSLISRYTTGPQLGLKLRSKLLNDWVILAGSVTNNSSTTEQFDFYREIDRNNSKTLNGRVALSAPLLHNRLELGFSGEWGAQDKDRSGGREIWFLGVDLQYLGTSVWLKAQAMRGGAPGTADDRVWGLKLRNSGYVEVDWMFLPRVGTILRAELRDAFVTLGTERAYLTKQMRFTGGARVVLNEHMFVKAEYYYNREYGGVEQFRNNMFTSSLVLAY
ncbi:MAG: hypothetical protein SF187_26390 [Deltaproteobacteria bacterium]|nr:hypothetical protein [Deltaproteobacteria bacterium]